MATVSRTTLLALSGPALLREGAGAERWMSADGRRRQMVSRRRRWPSLVVAVNQGSGHSLFSHCPLVGRRAAEWQSACSATPCARRRGASYLRALSLAPKHSSQIWIGVKPPLGRSAPIALLFWPTRPVLSADRPRLRVGDGAAAVCLPPLASGPVTGDRLWRHSFSTD